LIRSQNLRPAGGGASEGKPVVGSGSEKGLERDPPGFVTAMLNHEANILKDRGGDKNMALYS